ncbi:aconitate hydratase AcnA [Kitasatospora phosalacinea]|uniref:Aconitate hydratase n=1 Tax=Kitasatospora phosalacinea TaxID=2065 RepID=A0A0M3N196_9ACTN|nr:aconitate hydratase AcnA [Kitasatospora phosalacinea]AKO69602.1 Pmi [Kitasatospora phosalacinea]
MGHSTEGRFDRGKIRIGDEEFEYHPIAGIDGSDTLPYTLRILLENLLRHRDGGAVTDRDVRELASWTPAGPPREVLFHPARVLMQDYSGVPCLVDLAAMRDAAAGLGGDPARLGPRIPVDLVVDHSVMADTFGTPASFLLNAELDHRRNEERYRLLRWAEGAVEGLTVIPPNTGIVHQVNLERLATVVTERGGVLLPDTVVGTDSHTPMVNGLGVLGWGVGGIEALAAALGRPVSLRVPRVIGCELTGRPAPGVTATDVVLSLTERLRRHGVVGAFLEFHGPGMAALPLADRATIANMAPEFGSTCAYFPVDGETLRYLRTTGRSERQTGLVEAYAKAQGLWYDPADRPRRDEELAFDLGAVVPSLAGPRRPQDRVALAAAPESCRAAVAAAHDGGPRSVAVADPDGPDYRLSDGAVVLAAITSCTNTSNAPLMIAAGLLAERAVERGLTRKPWVKTTLAPGSAVVTGYLAAAGLDAPLERLGFHRVAYGCTTCIGNAGPLPGPVAAAIREGGLATAAVLSGNRNFEGRISPDVRMNYLASPPLVVAYALAGTMALDLTTEPLGHDPDGRPVHLADLWPSPEEVAEVAARAIGPELHRDTYAALLGGDERWRALPAARGHRFPWSADSTYVKPPPYLAGLAAAAPAPQDVRGARVLVKLGDSVTTDHISPAGSIPPDSPAGAYLASLGVPVAEFNSYGARRTNHEVLLRGLFANPRLRNQLLPGVEGGYTVDLLSGRTTTVYEAAAAYRTAGVPLVVLAGAEYGTGSSRDWAAKGPALMGVRAVLARSFERIHRSNLVGMGILPLQFPDGESADSLGLTGHEEFDIEGIAEFARGMPGKVTVRAGSVEFEAVVRVDTATEAEYVRHGGIMPWALRAALEPAR